MPTAAPRPCRIPGCPGLVTRGRYCPTHAATAPAPFRERKPDPRPNASSRGYGTAWQKARAGYLRKHRWCVECQRAGIMEPAVIVDHRTPHHGDRGLFWDSANWQALCRRHHNQKTAREDGGFGNPRHS